MVTIATRTATIGGTAHLSEPVQVVKNDATTFPAKGISATILAITNDLPTDTFCTRTPLREGDDR